VGGVHRRPARRPATVFQKQGGIEGKPLDVAPGRRADAEEKVARFRAFLQTKTFHRHFEQRHGVGGPTKRERHRSSASRLARRIVAGDPANRPPLPRRRH
jgi:hypothetical protein